MPLAWTSRPPSATPASETTASTGETTTSSPGATGRRPGRSGRAKNWPKVAEAREVAALARGRSGSGARRRSSAPRPTGPGKRQPGGRPHGAGEGVLGDEAEGGDEGAVVHGAGSVADPPRARPGRRARGREWTRFRAPRGTTLSCRGWVQEAALRMLMNNLDPEVAERPQDLVVYGGTGKAARNWESYHRIVAALRDLRDDETLLVQSGKPVGVLGTHPDAPRVLIANSNLVAALGHLGALPGAGAARPHDVRPDDGRLVDLHRHAGDPAGHLRDLRAGRPDPLRLGRPRRAARALRRPRRHGRRPAARRDHARRRLPRRGRGPGADRASGSRRATSTRRADSLDDALAPARRGAAGAAPALGRARAATPPTSTPSWCAAASPPTSSPTRPRPTIR